MVKLAMIVLSLAAAGAGAPTLYERVDARFAADPSLAQRLAEPPAELASFAWLVGEWDVEAEVYATATTPASKSTGSSHVEKAMGERWLRIVDRYPDGGTDEGFLTFDVARGTWVSVGLHESGAAVTSTARGWKGDTIVFRVDDAVIVGEQVALRQTLVRRGNDAYEVLNEERLPDGRWVKLDHYDYRRRHAP